MQGAPTPGGMMQQRPTGVTVLAVVAAIIGILGLLGSLTLLGLGGLAFYGAGAVGGLFFIGGLILLLVSVVELALAYGFWTLKPWAWQWGIALAVIRAVIAILGVIGIVFSESVVGALLAIVLSGVIIYYLNMPEIRRAFGAPVTGWPFIGTRY